MGSAFFMKICLIQIVLLFCINLSGQENWLVGQVHYSDGQVKNQSFNYSVSSTEGVLKVKTKIGQTTLTPQQVLKFTFYDSTFSRYREFFSVPTELRKQPNGYKHIFLELLHQGEKYALFRRFFPTKKVKVEVFIVMGLSGFQYWGKGDIEPSLFLYKEGDKAYQITEGVANDRKSRMDISIDQVILYNLDYKMIKPLLGSNWNELKKYCKKNNLGIRNENAWKEGLKFLDGSEFVYNRKETPKKLRN